MKSYIFTLLIILSFILSGCNNEYVAKIGKTKIDKGEYIVYLIEQKKSFEAQGGKEIWEATFDGVRAEDVAKQNALNSIVFVKNAVKVADSLNIEIDDDDEVAINFETNNLIKEISEDKLDEFNLTQKKIYNIMKEVKIQQKVYSYVTDSYVVNEAEFEDYLTQYYEQNKNQLNNYIIKEIFIQLDADGSNANLDKANEYYNRIIKGADFDLVLSEYMPSADLSPFVLDPSLFSENSLQEIYALGVDQVSLITDDEGYHIIKMVAVEPLDVDSIKAEVMEDYTSQQKLEIYQAQNNIWAGDTQAVKNDEVWNKIDLDI